ncbi:acyl dehydratase [Actimicrobium sp. GrIS 1.19]|uniref:MaoC family dehydratase n=1 Tax=Actimicrobium sp. GrIS 1.19 TaxID=3071708 RepID=UPI002DF85890|nr:acyl dehydratase [Actimicrobium sp. GrIS 1.19]
MREIASLEELKQLVGQEVAVSDWVEITQQRVQLFAEATDDHQWIHLDVDRSKAESPYGGTIAHGFLTLSLLPMLMAQSIHMTDVRMAVNYGLNKVRFPAPVPVGSRVRARMTLLEVEDIAGGAQIVWQVTIEADGSSKPVCVAESIVRRYT